MRTCLPWREPFGNNLDWGIDLPFLPRIMPLEHEKLKLYQKIFRHSSDGIAIFDPMGYYVQQNRANRVLLGYSDTDLIGKTPAIHMGEEMFKDFFRSLTENGRYRGEILSRRGSGETIRIDLSAFTVTDDDGHAVCHVALKRDATPADPAETVKSALAQSEEKYRTVLESSPDPVVVYDMEGHVQYINPAFTRTFGWSLPELIGRRIDFVPDENWPETREMIEKVLSGKGLSGYETRRYTKEGKIIDVSVSGAVSRDRWGNPVNSIINLRDITEKKKLEAQLLQAQKMEAVGTLAGGISHDFNNILQAISGYTQILLLDKAGDHPDYTSLQAIEKAAQRAGELTRQLLIFGRKVEGELRPMDLNREVIQVANILKRTIPKMIRIELQLAENLKEVLADPVHLEQILMNLAVNARDAMPDGGKLLFFTDNIRLDRNACKAHRVSFPGEYVLLRISDTGHGIDGKTLERIFEPFFTTKETGKGTGLGLAMVYGSVHNFGGEIHCSSETGSGTTFEIYLPVIESKTSEGAENRADNRIVGGRETILIVDDEAVILDVGRTILERYGYSVLTVKSGEQALELYQKKGKRFDLVLLDLNMPGMGGDRCLKEILKVNSHAKVVIATGYRSRDHEENAYRSGAAGFVGKPYNITELMGKVREVLDG